MSMSCWKHHLSRGLVCGLAAAACLGAPGAAEAQEEDLDREFRFASELVALGFPDYATKVTERIIRFYPDQKERAQIIQAEILVARRRFEEAEALAASLPDDSPRTRAIRLAIANGYFAIGDNEKAKALYTQFFQQVGDRAPDDPDLKRFYMEAAYKFAQMQQYAGDLGGAARGYENVLKAEPEEVVARRVKADLAEIYVKRAAENPNEREAHLERAKALCEDVQWGGMDILSGQTVTTMAHIEMVRGRDEEALKVLNNYMDVLKRIDEILKEQDADMALSPMAPARFLLGELYRKQGESLAGTDRDAAVTAYGNALKQFYNVFVKYSESQWGPEAGTQAQEIIARLEDDFGKTVNIKMSGEQQRQRAAAEFRQADRLFRERRYAEAAEEYLQVVNSFPESDDAPRVLSNLGVCWGNLNRTLYVKMLVDYLAERFAGNDRAALGLLAIGKIYFDRGEADLYQPIYDAYVDQFPEHDRVPAVLYSLSIAREKSGDTRGARAYRDRIVEDYSRSQFSLRALNRMGWDLYEKRNYDKAAARFARFIELSQPGPDVAKAQFALADSLLRSERPLDALREYLKLKKWISQEDTPYAVTEEDRLAHRDLLEKTDFYIPYALSQVDEPADKVPQFRDQALAAYDRFVADYPDSALAPRALSAKGGILLERGRHDAATDTFEELARRYPETEDGRSARYALIKAALEVERFDIARDAFREMLGEGARYEPSQFVQVGERMMENDLLAEALEAYAYVRDSGTEERRLLERALYGEARGHFQLEQYPEAVRAAGELLERYPKSALFYDAKFILGRSHRARGNLSEAKAQLSDVFRYATDPALINTASFELGQIQKEEGDLEAALASFQRIALLADPDDPEIRPLIEKSLLESLDLFEEVGRYADVIDACDRYEEVFPEGDDLSEVRRRRANAVLKAATAEGAS
jgi:TolA-binding protein